MRRRPAVPYKCPRCADAGSGPGCAATASATLSPGRGLFSSAAADYLVAARLPHPGARARHLPATRAAPCWHRSTGPIAAGRLIGRASSSVLSFGSVRSCPGRRGTSDDWCETGFPLGVHPEHFRHEEAVRAPRVLRAVGEGELVGALHCLASAALSRSGACLRCAGGRSAGGVGSS